MNLDCPHVITTAKEAYNSLRAYQPRKEWDRLDANQKRNYLIIGKHIVENYERITTSGVADK
jgi:hypothetical protein